MASSSSAVSLSAVPNSSAASWQESKDLYMERFAKLFEDDLVQIYESDTTGEAVKHLRACVEAGAAVWGYPLALPDPTAS
mmetsp:Transcript_71420/g.83087  ORF Transcript_71420/g.83087 Transcript_71420/m.83087 type:complete len:80 (-) Transcript_71420:68-307(-)